jgi:hypothetical protein
VTKRVTEAALVASTWTQKQLRRMDERFVRAVRKAIAAGSESVTEISVSTAFSEGVPGSRVGTTAELEKENYHNDVQHIRNEATRQARR